MNFVYKTSETGMLKKFASRGYLIVLLILVTAHVSGQARQETQWTSDGYFYYKLEKGAIIQTDSRTGVNTEVVSTKMLTMPGSSTAIPVRRFMFSADRQKLLIMNNTKRVWRYDTKGDYYLYDLKTGTLKQLGKRLPSSSLMYAKISPDGTKAAYVSAHNLYVEDLQTSKVSQLTFDGTDRVINGTFDWVYEEEFGCRDGFRWSPDSKKLAYWQIDASNIRNYLMINTTDSVYSFTVPVEYPKAGEDPSSCRIAVIAADGGKPVWMNVPGDAVQHYIPRMEWAYNSNELIIQQLNRKQNESRVMLCNAGSGAVKTIYTEKDNAWIDIKSRWNDDDPSGWEWISGGKEFLWVSEKDGWRHIYRIDRNGKEVLVTKGNYDISSINLIDEKGGYIYFDASPSNATQAYLYRVPISGKKQAERITPALYSGTNSYLISPNGKVAFHRFSSSLVSPASERVDLPSHKTIGANMAMDSLKNNRAEFFKVKTTDGVVMDGWMVKPANFDPSKRYPVVFYVYGEPAGQTVTDSYGTGFNRLYEGDMANDGYIYMSVENRGAPAPKGREWRKSIYKNIGILNIRDQAMAAKEILKWPFVDSSRVAVWGWSGGGSSTLNLLFQYPEIYKTGIAVAAVASQLSYDNIYQERYMGNPKDDKKPFIDGSPISHVQNLRGNLLYIHGTGDDNVHYQNAELLINELIKYNKQFQLMSYPNRTHSISEGEGTREHLSGLFTNFLKTHCPPGGR
ncbi:S9 family peptidase [Arcticibacter tournemirensis]|nr:S9 family peptidase [Arcticibacter tournemirensis]